MAFNFQTFKTRAMSAIVFVVIMLTGLLWNHWTFFLLFSIIHFGCWFEYQKLVGLIDKEYQEITPFHKYGVMIAGWAIMLYMTNNAFQIANIRLHEIGWFVLLVCGVVLPLTEVLFTKNFNVRSIGYSIFGIFYISVGWAMMIGLRTHGMLFTDSLLSLDLGWVIPILLISTIWINDTMAYIVGSLIGKTPLSSISPKKTWEGTIGGALLAVATVTLVSYSLIRTADVSSIIIISSIGAIIGTLGDLLQSKLKRLAGVKDSGRLMPGHGGFLDRFDSLVLATPFVWIYIVWLQNV